MNNHDDDQGGSEAGAAGAMPASGPEAAAGASGERPDSERASTAMPAGPPRGMARPGMAALVYVFAAIVLTAGVAWLVLNPGGGARRQIVPLRVQLGDLQTRLAAVQANAEAANAAVSKLAGRVAALEQRPDAGPAIAALGARVDGLAHGLARGLAARPGGGASPAEQADLAQAGQQLAALASQMKAAQGTMRRNESRLAGLGGQVALLARLEAAAMALREGKPLGAIAGAPPALAQFADKAPPTEASLALGFQKAAEAVRAAQPAPASGGFWQRSLDRMGRLVTVTRGDQVVLGDPAEAALSRARIALGAGDLPQAVAVAASLQGAQAQAMAAWLGQARSLLAARAALAEMLGSVAAGGATQGGGSTQGGGAR